MCWAFVATGEGSRELPVLPNSSCGVTELQGVLNLLIVNQRTTLCLLWVKYLGAGRGRSVFAAQFLPDSVSVGLSV